MGEPPNNSIHSATNQSESSSDQFCNQLNNYQLRGCRRINPEWRTVKLRWFLVACSPHKHTPTQHSGVVMQQTTLWAMNAHTPTPLIKPRPSGEQSCNKSSEHNVINICAAASGYVWSSIAPWSSWWLPRIVPTLSSQMTSPNPKYLTAWCHLGWCNLLLLRKSLNYLHFNSTLIQLLNFLECDYIRKVKKM